MNDIPIDAHITLTDTIFYPVKLYSIPSVGDLIDLWSFIDQAAKREPRRYLEVVKVLHKVYDTTDKYPQGNHFVTVIVKESQSEYFAFSPS